MQEGNIRVGVVGLGYVGLPLAVEMAKYFDTIGFDINKKRIQILQKGRDPNGEVSDEELKSSRLKYDNNPSVISKVNFVIVAVPTPVNDHNIPDLTPVISASRIVGKQIAPKTIVVYESTVYPGVTEDECVPILEKESGLTWKKDFFVGYSPERINPGDKEHTFSKILKVVSGDTDKTLDIVAHVYETAVKVGVYRAKSIKVAEAAKVIENTQRDINIAFVNELKIIFDKMGISTKDVLDAAKTKWNFLPFTPGLVGGHCIGVDPYYLAYKAEEIGHHPQLILAGRRINDAMGSYFGRELIKKMIKNNMQVNGAKVLICGITFKENCPDIRNSHVLDIIRELTDFSINIDVWDPVADKTDVKSEYGIDLTENPKNSYYNAVLLAVGHRDFIKCKINGLNSYLVPNGIFYNIKEIDIN